jgi:hypothetical protein
MIAVERCLVVANRTMSSPKLIDFAAELHRRQPCTFHLLVPATAPSEDERHGMQIEQLVSRRGEAPGFTLARYRLQRSRSAWAEHGLEADGEVGDPDIMIAVRDAVAGTPMDLIVLSTLHRPMSHWVRQDLPARLLRATKVPVLHLENDAAVPATVPA